jgi:hypothetical protein
MLQFCHIIWEKFVINHNPVRSSFMTYHWLFNKSNTMGPTSGLVTAYPIRGTCLHSFCKWSSCSSILCFLCSVLQTIVYPFNLFFWPLYCLSYFNVRLFISPFVSSSFSIYWKKYQWNLPNCDKLGRW